MAEVSLHKVNKKFDLNHVVKDVDLEIRDKEFMVFVGPSGCGKTTTLRMIAGLEAITSGDIRIGDTVVNEVPPMDRDIAMVFQNYALYPHMSVASNLAFGLKMRKFQKSEIEQRIKRAASILGIKKLHERLSVTSIYVTHDQVEAMTLGDRVVVMKDGVVQQVGEPLELYNTPANRFVAGFIGSPAMNFAEVTLARDSGRLWAMAPGLKIGVPDRIAQRANGRDGVKATIGIRPEDIHIAGPADGAESCFEAEVEVVEQLGSEILLDTRVGNTAFVASVDPGLHMRVHERLKLALNPTRLHLFDAETEAAI